VEGSAAQWDSIVCMDEMATFDPDQGKGNFVVEPDPARWGASYFWGQEYLVEDESVFSF
jgi:hypothetical protein